MFGYITCGFPRIFGYVLQVIKYSILVPLERGGFGGWNLMRSFLALKLTKVSETLVCIYVYIYLYNELSYARILIGSHL